MKKTILFLLTLPVFMADGFSQISSSFEIRYFSKDKTSSGITDFKGKNEFFNTEQRIEFLQFYADVAGKWFSDTALNSLVNNPEETVRLLEDIKEQPLPVKRDRILLENWKKTAYQQGDHDRSVNSIIGWDTLNGASVNQGLLHLTRPNVIIEKPIDSLQWRFFLSWKAMSLNGNFPMTFALKENNRTIAEAGFHANGNIFYTANGIDKMGEQYVTRKWYHFKIEADLVNSRYNLYINGVKTEDWIAMRNSSLINRIRISGGEAILLDDITGLKFDTTGCGTPNYYTIEPFIQENFNLQHSLQNWTEIDYDDRSWEQSDLPSVADGVLEAGKDLYLRKKLKIGSFEKARLNIEALDPGGEVWINGRVVHVTHNRHPVSLDITPFLLPYSVNTIAIRVFSILKGGSLYYPSQERNTGWFCGRAWIDLTEQIHIHSVKVFTKSLNRDAIQLHNISLQNDSDTTFSGKVMIDYYPWHPNESSSKVATFEFPVKIFARDSVHLDLPGTVKQPFLWSHDKPNLYRIHVRIMHGDRLIDDEMVTTGIRTVSQENGIFRINGEPEFLGGAQTMGFRIPIENNPKWNHSPPAHILADELLAGKKLGNALRIQVDAGRKYTYSINNARIAEIADQLGVMLIWPTTDWIHQGKLEGTDLEGFPKNMEQVLNRPSIVIWEVPSHPDRFGNTSLAHSNRYISKAYHAISNVDSSRLIYPGPFNRQFIYGNDDGTIDQNGNAIRPCDEWSAPLIVRGNQDTLTGYGAEWHMIREWPDPYMRSFIESSKRACFNFDLKESGGMQNIELARGKPWYQLPSYENHYNVVSIGRRFESHEWRESQAWQAFSAWEAIKWQRIHDVDGLIWCCLHGSPTGGAYPNPIIDAMGHAKLGFYSNKMALQDIVAGSNNTDVVYHRKDEIRPVIMHVGKEQAVKLKIIIKNIDGKITDTRVFNNLLLEEGRNIKEIDSFRPKFDEEGYYTIEYFLLTP